MGCAIHNESQSYAENDDPQLQSTGGQETGRHTVILSAGGRPFQGSAGRRRPGPFPWRHHPINGNFEPVAIGTSASWLLGLEIPSVR